jgi:hypothetical protein
MPVFLQMIMKLLQVLVSGALCQFFFREFIFIDLVPIEEENSDFG